MRFFALFSGLLSPRPSCRVWGTNTTSSSSTRARLAVDSALFSFVSFSCLLACLLAHNGPFPFLPFSLLLFSPFPSSCSCCLERRRLLPPDAAHAHGGVVGLIRLGVEHHLDAAVLLVVEDAVRLGGLLQRQLVRDDDARVQLLLGVGRGKKRRDHRVAHAPNLFDFGHGACVRPYLVLHLLEQHLPVLLHGRLAGLHRQALLCG